MQQKFYSLKYIIYLLISLGLLTGCANYLSNVGRTATEYQVIPIKENLGEQQEWKTKDLKVFYTVKEAGDTFSVNGYVEIDSSITNSFTSAERFNFFINYLDENNTVISTHQISPNTGYHTVMPKHLKLRNIPDAPPQAVSFVFSYWGIFVGSGTPADRSGSWEIYFRPFEKNN